VTSNLVINHIKYCLSITNFIILKHIWTGYVPIETALTFTKYMHHESELIVWKALLNKLRRPRNLLYDTSAFESFKVAKYTNTIFNVLKHV